MQIDERQFGNLTVLDLKGKMILGEGDELLKDKINSLILQNRKVIALNLAEVPYIDSAGLGEIVRTYTATSRHGGKLVLCDLTKRIEDLLTGTKLLTVFVVYRTVEEAVADFTGPGFEVSCPVCQPLTWVRVRGPLADRTAHHCPSCLCGFSFDSTVISLPAIGATDPPQSLSVASLRFPTYEKESVIVEMPTNKPSRITVLGRLDLFASEVVEKAWQTLPSPRRVVFSLTDQKDFTQSGLARLFELCEVWRDDNRSVIEIGRDTSAELTNVLAGHPRVFKNASAATALGDVRHLSAVRVALRMAV